MSNPRTGRPASGRVVAAVAMAALLITACSSDKATTVTTTGTAGTGAASSTAATSAPSATGGSTPAAGTPSAAFEAQVDQAAQTMLTQATKDGATAVHVAVADPQQGDVVKAYGTVSTGGAPASLDDTFPIGSITKTFTAVVILKLIESGQLSLDDTVNDRLPDLAAKYPDLAPLTVQQLLTMTSGVPDYLNVPDSVVTEIVADPHRVWKPEELIGAAVAAGVQPPGTPGYSTTNFLILQLIAESIGGKPLQDLIAADVTTPLGMAHTFLPPPDDTTLPSPSTHGYIAGGCVDELTQDGATLPADSDTSDWNTSYAQGGGAMASTIGDLLTWAESTAGNTLLDDDLATQRLQTAPIPGGIDYGLGIFKVGSWYGHEGEAIGWEALSVTDPDTGVSVALAANGCGGIFEYFADFLDALYPDGGALAALTGGSGGDQTDTSTPDSTPDDTAQQVNFVADEQVLTGAWTACSWDGTSLTLDATAGDSEIKATTAADGTFAITVTGSPSWTATGTGTETDGVLTIAGTGSPAGGSPTAIALLVYTAGCS